MKRVVHIGLTVLVAAVVMQGCNKKSSDNGAAARDKQAAADLQAERQKLEDERVKVEAERKRAEEERTKNEAERKKLEDERLKNVPPIPGTATPATSVFSCSRAGGNMMSQGPSCEDYYNFTAAEVGQYQNACTTASTIPGLPIPLPMGSAGTWGTTACPTNLGNRARAGGCRSQDSKYVIWYYGANQQQVQTQCMMRGMTYVN